MFYANAVMIFMHHKNTQSVMAFPLAVRVFCIARRMAASDLISDTLGFGGAERQAGQPPGTSRSTRFCFSWKMWIPLFFVPNAGIFASFRWPEFVV